MKDAMQTTYILLKIDHTQPIPDLTDLVAGRAYTMDKVEDVTATAITKEESLLHLLLLEELQTNG